MNFTPEELRAKGFIQVGDSFMKVTKDVDGIASIHTQKPVERESDLHNAIMEYCANRWPKWLAIHGSMVKRSTVTTGAPDFVILAPDKTTLYIECKSKTGKRTPEQLAFAKQAEALGHTVYEVRSFEEFVSVLEDKELA
jgi:hypothetical protein